MAVKKIILFVEGEPNTPNGDLRQGFSKLLEKRLALRMPSIKLGAGKTPTIQQFKTSKLESDLNLLLIDLDKPETEYEKDLAEHGLLEYRENVYYMIQEMESWFLSQPDILDEFYGVENKGKSISEKLVKKHAKEIPHPDQELKKVTKDSKRGEYHKIKHAVELLKRLDPLKLEGQFQDFKRLIEKIIST